MFKVNNKFPERRFNYVALEFYSEILTYFWGFIVKL